MDAKERAFLQNIALKLSGVFGDLYTFLDGLAPLPAPQPVPQSTPPPSTSSSSTTIYAATDIPHVAYLTTRGEWKGKIGAKQSMLFRIHIDKAYKTLGVSLDCLNQTNGGLSGGSLKYGSPPVSFGDPTAKNTSQKAGATNDSIPLTNYPLIGDYYLLVTSLFGANNGYEEVEISWQVS